MPTITIIGDSASYSIAHSFVRGAKHCFETVHFYDVQQQIDKHVRFGKIGRKLNPFFNVEIWTRKGNRDLSVFLKNNPSDIVLVIGNAPVLFSTIAFIKSISHTQFYIFWPDTLTNLTATIKDAAFIYDKMLSYSSKAAPIFEKMGFAKVDWFPFAGDPDYLGQPNDKQEFNYDIGFIGGWRPEREAAMAAIATAFPDKSIYLSGPGWKQNLTHKPLLKYLHEKYIMGQDFGNLLKQCRINLNIIDDTNYPAANMRFFEIPAVGALQLSSSCPEQESFMKEGETIFYYKHQDELLEKVKSILDNDSKAATVRANATNYMKEHTYQTRFERLLENL